MKYFLVVVLAFSFFSVQAKSVKKKVDNRTQYEKSVAATKWRFNQKSKEIVKAKKENDALIAQSDSVLVQTKAKLKALYDAEIKKIVDQENALKEKKAKIDSTYKEATSALVLPVTK